MSSNIEEMEKYKSLYCRDYPKAEIWVASFMECCINSLKDIHEENCKIWKELAELKGKQDFKCMGLDDKGDYVYEPNE
jgi:hypothetical protein